MGFFYMMSMCVSTLDVTEREMQVLLTRIMDIRHCTKFLDSCFFLLQIILSFPILTLSENLLCTASDHIFPLPLAVLCPHQCHFIMVCFLCFQIQGCLDSLVITTALNIFLTTLDCGINTMHLLYVGQLPIYLQALWFYIAFVSL